tara:strand:+ start:2029 stop:3279 length:1251 start_codon:yes stop_codon:yes gene_type:complete
MSDLVSMRAEEVEARSRVDVLLGVDGELTAEQLTELEAADVQVRELKTKIKAAEIRASAKAAIESPSFEFKGTSGQLSITQPELNSREQFIRNLNHAVKNGGIQERFIDFASTATGATGNALSLLPVDLQNETVRMLGDMSSIRSAVDVRTYESDVEIPLVSARASVVAYTGEGQPAAEFDPDFSKARIRSYASRIRTKVTNEVLQDSRGNAVGEILKQQAEETARWFESRMMSNTAAQSAGDVDGLLATDFTALPSSPADYTTPATKTTTDDVTYADLVSTAYKMKASYWGLPKNWILSPAMFTSAMKLLDGNGRPILQPAAMGTAQQSPAFGTLLGYPVLVSDALTDASPAGSFQALLLERSSYIVADRVGMASQVDPFGDNALNGMVSYYLSFRSDGRWLRPESSSRLKLSAT